MKLFLNIFAVLAVLVPIVAQARPSNSAVSADGRRTTVSAVAPAILRVDNVAPGQTVAPEQSVLALDGDFARIDKGCLATASGMEAAFGPDGVLTIKTPLNTLTDLGTRAVTDSLTEISLAIGRSGSWYGGGERGHRLNLAGDTLVMYNRQNYGYTGNDSRISQMNITMPVVLSSEGFALVFDDYAAAELIAGDPVRYISESRLPITYYYVYGSSHAELTEALTELTGRQPLPPLWALGYITSKYGYRTQAETVGAVDTLKTAGYPLDGIVLDLYWYGKEEDMGRLAWDPVQWPDPAGMLASLADRGVRTVAISQPYVLRNGRGADNYTELSSKGALLRDASGAPQEVKIWVGEGGMFDVSSPAAKEWLSARYKSLTDMGMGGWWGDLGEPEVHPLGGVHANGQPARLYHNKYGNDWSAIVADMWAKNYPDRRLMTLMRGGTTGLQRYSVFPWSTDVSRSWGGFEPQIRIMLNSGLSGLGYMASDIGGFAVGEEPYIPELYLRWVQLGLFSPVLRTHAQQYAEPYHYPQYEAELLAIVKERYRYLPYNYTLAYENARHGWPLVRTLDFHDRASGQYDGISDEFLWGRDILVAPVMKEGARSRNIVLPSGSRWIDMNNTSSVYAGGTTVYAYPAPLDVLPVFVRAGAFVPTADYGMENTCDYRADEFTINYYPLDGVESVYTLYDDNRLSPRSLDTGEYRLIRFDGECRKGAVEIKIASEGTYPGAPEQVKLRFVVNCINKAPKSIEINNKKTQYRFDPAARTVEFDFEFRPGTPATVKIK